MQICIRNENSCTHVVYLFVEPTIHSLFSLIGLILDKIRTQFTISKILRIVFLYAKIASFNISYENIYLCGLFFTVL